MGENDSIYNQLNQEKKPVEFSRIGIIPKGDSYALTSSIITTKLMSDKDINLLGINYYPMRNFEHYKIELLFENQFYYCIIHETKNIKEFIKKLPKATVIKDEHLEMAYHSNKLFHVNVMFSRDILSSYLFQLRLAKNLFDDAIMLIDFSSRMLLSIDWLNQMVDSNIPPAPSFLFSVNEMIDPINHSHWFFTKGLLRCGNPDIEMINITQNIIEMKNFIKLIGESFVIEHYKENDIIEIGYDGLGLNVLWRRWENEKSKDSEKEINGINLQSRLADDWGPSGIIYAVEDKANIVSPEIYGSTLRNNPVIYIKHEETERMRDLALINFHIFEDTFAKHTELKKKRNNIFNHIFRKKKENLTHNIEDWIFRVKLGFPTDYSEYENNYVQKEYLWFEVCYIEKDNIGVRLLNMPYWIKTLKKNKFYLFSIKNHLIDWTIFSQKIVFTPNNAFALEYEL